MIPRSGVLVYTDIRVANLGIKDLGIYLISGSDLTIFQIVTWRLATPKIGWKFDFRRSRNDLRKDDRDMEFSKSDPIGLYRLYTRSDYQGYLGIKKKFLV